MLSSFSGSGRIPSSESIGLKIRRSWFQSPQGQFLTKLFCSSLCKDLSDNLTETPILKNSSVTVNQMNLTVSMTLTNKYTHSTFSSFSSSVWSKFAPTPVTATLTFSLGSEGRMTSHFSLIISATGLQPDSRGIWNK